jgi:hypothetical protein
LTSTARSRRATFAGKERLTHALQLVIRHRRLANLTARMLTRRPALLDVALGAF